VITEETQHRWLDWHLSRSDNEFSDPTPAWIRLTRETARKAIYKIPALNKKQEAWRYTDIEGILSRRFIVDNSFLKQPINRINAITPGKAANTHQLIFVNGQLVKRYLDFNNMGVKSDISIKTVSELTNKDEDRVVNLLSEQDPGSNLFANLNAALLNDAVFIHIGKNADSRTPIELVFLSHDIESSDTEHANNHSPLAQPRIIISLEESAKATIIERFSGDAKLPYAQNMVCNIFLDDNAQLNHYRLQDEPLSATHISNIYIAQKPKSDYRGTHIAVGAAWSRTEYHQIFSYPDANFDIQGLSLIGEAQFNDVHLSLHHKVGHCTSRELFKTLLVGKGRAVFDGHVIVEKKAQKTNASMSSNSLFLTRSAEIDTKPQLEIYADDVQCSHGATVGELDENQLYYLRSRGIEQSSARKLLCLGFASNILDTIEVNAIKELCANRITSIIQDHAT